MSSVPNPLLRVPRSVLGAGNPRILESVLSENEKEESEVGEDKWFKPVLSKLQLIYPPGCARAMGGGKKILEFLCLFFFVSHPLQVFLVYMLSCI